MLIENLKHFTEHLPDPKSAERFLAQLDERFPREARKLRSENGLFSDVLTLVGFSPLLAATLIQNPDYISWLRRQRKSEKVRNKEEILESLARFDLTNSGIETNILLARFRRRELLRIYLRDIRNLGTIAEITEEISNLADAILEYALRIAMQQMENRFGSPFETDENGRSKQSSICIVALGKLGSKELNYSSDIDLLFLYSDEGATAAKGKETITNREFFVKLVQLIVKLVGGQGGEGAAYRVDLRLRPNGRVGAVACSFTNAIEYYKTTARTWERQVLIRSRVSAGDAEIFTQFFDAVKSTVFSIDETVGNALENVRLSKEKIDLQKTSENGFNVKLGKGGIREIEFIAQALQLAFGGSDEWIRASHTLISLDRLADRRLLTERELTQLFEAYTFFRRLEHRLQMENGLQTHTVPDDLEKRIPIAKRMDYIFVADFNSSLTVHSENVSRIFRRIFGNASDAIGRSNERPKISKSAFGEQSIPTVDDDETTTFKLILSSRGKSLETSNLSKIALESLNSFSKISPPFAEMIAANPRLSESFAFDTSGELNTNYRLRILDANRSEDDFSAKLSKLRKDWSECLIEIVRRDVFETISIADAKNAQTKLAEASIETAVEIAKSEIEFKYKTKIDQFPFAVLGLGKLGGGGLDYGSDLDLILVYDEDVALPIADVSAAEIYSRAVEIFVTTLSSLTRDGLLYRVDLRLRPDGNSGATCLSKAAFLQYLHTRSAPWEWLAYVKLRGVGGDLNLAKSTENESRAIIHQNALNDESESLRKETLRVREMLEKEKTGNRKRKEIDIKFGDGGMLDIYFALRYLQLRDNIPDDPEHRSTSDTIVNLHDKNSLNAEDFGNFSKGYEFLSSLDHSLRLVVGRSTVIPRGNRSALETIASRLRKTSFDEVADLLAIHRLNIRESFLNILS